MAHLPVIVGFGGFNSAGRSSFHHAYQRMIIESLPVEERQETLADLAILMGILQFESGKYVDENQVSYTLQEIDEQLSQMILERTLVRRIENQFFDVDAVHWQKEVSLNQEAGKTTTFTLAKKQLPTPVPLNWEVAEVDKQTVKITVAGDLSVKMDSYRDITVKSAGQLPSGFDPSKHYKSRFHPRALQMAILGASDAINSMGIDWQTVMDSVQPDEVAVYSSNAMSQLDEPGLGGMLTSRLKGGRVTTKQCPLGLNSMPADFINAYVLGSLGSTGAITGACASFLYNLRAGIEDISSGRRRVVVVGNSEAPITPEIIDGYATMSALASVEGLKKLDNVEVPDFQKTSRPFGENCGFTIAESSQYTVLMDDALAMELGADIHGAATDVFVNADGVKKSISSPGAGNYVTMAKAVAAARAMLGDDAVQNRSFIQAHGSSTPQNRVTESVIFDSVAKAFDITQWPVTAIKSYVGHSLAPASADQLVASLGVFKHGILPGIKTIDKVADDVHQQRLEIALQDRKEEAGKWDVAFLNSKGFGGNNATATLLSPQVVEGMLSKRYGETAMTEYKEKREKTRAKAQAYDTAASKGDLKVIYRFGEKMIDESEITLTNKSVSMPGYLNEISLPQDNPFSDMV
jgi:acetoacetyl-[acyl-carrier protein] synthase